MRLVLVPSDLPCLRRYVRRHVAKTVRLRFVPDIRFFLDDSIEKDEEV